MEASDRSLKDIFAREALFYIPKILQLCDRNPISPTYGCFDRSFWHYRTMDFPSGMYQEYVLPLALIYKYGFPGNNWRGQARIRELCLAGISFAAKSSHSDGSCDDYFPFERALGAAAFSLYAATESLLVLEERPAAHMDFIIRRASFLSDARESGQLSNHHALCALALYNSYLVTGQTQFEKAAHRKFDELLSWQEFEGWFPEYEGCDPGYLTASLSFLAQYARKANRHDGWDSLIKCARFCSNFIHYDGSYAGEYGSRNTYHFYPYGFELVGKKDSFVTAVNDLYLRGIRNGKRYYNEDDRVFCHTVYDYLQAYLNYCEVRENPEELFKDEILNFPEAGFLVAKTKDEQVIVNYRKGGVIKAFTEKGCVLSDTGVSLLMRDGRRLVSHMVSRGLEFKITGKEIFVSGSFHDSKQRLLSPIKQIIFRALNLTIARLSSQFFRQILQRMIILHKDVSEMSFSRRILIKSDRILIEDELRGPSSSSRVDRIVIGSDQTSIYTAAGNSYQESVLIPWLDFKDEVEELNARGLTRLNREILFRDKSS